MSMFQESFPVQKKKADPDIPALRCWQYAVIFCIVLFLGFIVASAIVVPFVLAVRGEQIYTVKTSYML